ncbi:rod-determining factor RdfA [Natronomonas amylolytica]|uniref:rod-determining factor RdfA n=1 Tax=Natronomonas amylolytica TaxID=3108498 RepID=UPI003AB18FDB
MAEETECEIEALADKYGLSLDVLDADIRQDWTEGKSLQEITDWFNERLLRAAGDHLGRSGRPVEEYRAKMTESEVSECRFARVAGDAARGNRSRRNQ